MVVLHELGVCFDEEGRPHSSKTNELITMENLELDLNIRDGEEYLELDPVVLVTAITRYVGFECLYQ